MISRRSLVAGAAFAATGAVARAQEFWLDIKGDDGKPVPNMRAPVELLSRIDQLRGAIRIGAENPDVRLVEFYDLNCPFCRRAVQDIDAMLATDPELGVTLIDAPILSKASKEAALIETAVMKLHGREIAHRMHRALLGLRGTVSAQSVLDEAAKLGLDAEALTRAGRDADVIAAVNAQLDIAAALGVAATPSFVAGNFVLQGYPGPAALARVVSSLRACDNPAC